MSRHMSGTSPSNALVAYISCFIVLPDGSLSFDSMLMHVLVPATVILAVHRSTALMP